MGLQRLRCLCCDRAVGFNWGACQTSAWGQSRRLAACRSLPVFHDQRTSSVRPGMSQRCHQPIFHPADRTKPLLRRS